MKKIINIILIILCFSVASIAQNKKNKAPSVNLSFVVQDPQGQPINNASVFANSGKYKIITDTTGKVNIENVPGNSVVLIECPGYTDVIWNIGTTAERAEVVMQKVSAGESANDTYTLFEGIQTNKRHTVGAVSIIDGKELETFPSLSLSNALQGRAAGLSANMTMGSLSENNADFLIRGLHRQSNNAPIVVVDGMERNFDDLIAEEIETIQILKDPTTKIIYGPRAANGVIAVTTKRGEANKRVVKTTMQQFVGLTTRMPEFLDSYEYAQLYNKALVNDNQPELYTEDDLNGYLNSKGNNDLRYPNVDYYDYFLRSHTLNTQLTTQFLGGDKNTRYAVVIGLNNGSGLEKQGNQLKYTRANIRGNVDMKFNEIFSANMGAAIRLQNKNWAKMNSGQLFSRLSETRPNEYPFILDTSELSYVPTLDDGSLVAGASMDKKDNLYADIVLDGYDKEQYISNQMNFGLNGNFNSLVKGLSADAYVTFDNYFLANYRLDNITPTYAMRWDKLPDGTDTCIFIPRKLGELKSSADLQSRNSDRNVGVSLKANYERTFDEHYIQSNIGYYFYFDEVRQWDQNIVNSNTYARVHYAFKNKVIVEASAANMRSNRFATDLQTKVYPAVGAAYILSEDVAGVGYLKIKASFGILGYDAASQFPLSTNRWTDNNDNNNQENITFGDGNGGKTYPVVKIADWASPNLGWEESTEINVGFEGLALNNRFGYEVNFFNETRTQIEGIIAENYSEIYGNFLPHENYKEVTNSGIEVDLNWHETAGGFKYVIGANFTYAKNTFTQKDETLFPDTDRRLENKPTDAILGFVTDGIYTTQDQITNDDVQKLGTITKIGDINYQDLNNDGEIDELDQKVIGNKTPRVVLGLDINLSYKNFGVYILGTSSLGFYIDQQELYYTTGNEKYLSYARDAFDPATGIGTKPRLTALGRSANEKTSDFWLEKGDYFRLKNAEISYTIRSNNAKAVVSNVKFFGRGANLLVISAVKDVDPEVPMAGIKNYPVLRTFSIGASVNF